MPQDSSVLVRKIDEYDKVERDYRRHLQREKVSSEIHSAGGLGEHGKANQSGEGDRDEATD
jgi:hypothetical protein